MKPGVTPFGRLWIAAATSGLSQWMVQIALFYSVLHDHGAPALAWVVLLGTLPSFLLGPILGTAADRWSAGRAVQVAGLAQALCLLVLSRAVSGPIPWLVLAYAGSNVLSALEGPSRQRLLYQTVALDERSRANASIGSISGIVTILGALLGGTVGLLGVVPIFLGASLFRLIGTAWLLGLRPRVQARTKSGRRVAPYGSSLKEGFEAIGRFPRATSVLLVGIAWGLVGGGYDVLLSDYGVHLLRGGSMGLATLYVVDGLGVLIGISVSRRLATRLRSHAYGWSYVLQGLFWTFFSLSHSMTMSVPLLFLMRIASGIIIAWDTTLLLETVPERLHGRVYSLHMSTYGGVMRLSLMLTGLLLAVVGPRGVAVGAGCASVMVGLTWWLTVGRRWPGGSPALEKEGVDPSLPGIAAKTADRRPSSECQDDDTRCATAIAGEEGWEERFAC